VATRTDLFRPRSETFKADSSLQERPASTATCTQHLFRTSSSDVALNRRYSICSSSSWIALRSISSVHRRWRQNGPLQAARWIESDPVSRVQLRINVAYREDEAVHRCVGTAQRRTVAERLKSRPVGLLQKEAKMREERNEPSDDQACLPGLGRPSRADRIHYPLVPAKYLHVKLLNTSSSRARTGAEGHRRITRFARPIRRVDQNRSAPASGSSKA
jgi:hypothetical protein